jgi:hypothetical protein
MTHEMNILFRTLFVITLLALSNPASPETLDVDSVLERMIHAYGGEENLRKLNSMTQVWDFVALVRNQHGTDVRKIRMPAQLKVELTYPDKSETRILDGESSYVIFNEGPATVARLSQNDAMRLQLMRLYSPMVLHDMRESLTLALEDKFCALSLVENGLRVDYLVNMETWNIDKVVGTLSIQGSEMRFLTEYSNFRLHDGVLVHERENKYAGGVNTAVLQLRSVTLDAELNDDSFAPHVTEK